MTGTATGPAHDLQRSGFLSALGEELAEAVSPPVPFVDASPHECCEAARGVLGADLAPPVLAGLDEDGLRRLADALGAWFEVEPPALPRVRHAVERTLARWPTEEWTSDLAGR